MYAFILSKIYAVQMIISNVYGYLFQNFSHIHVNQRMWMQSKTGQESKCRKKGDIIVKSCKSYRIFTTKTAFNRN